MLLDQLPFVCSYPEDSINVINVINITNQISSLVKLQLTKNGTQSKFTQNRETRKALLEQLIVKYHRMFALHRLYKGYYHGISNYIKIFTWKSGLRPTFAYS